MITKTGLIIEGYGTVDPNTIIDVECGMQLGLSIIFFFSALAESNTSNVGFNLILTALIFLVYPVLAHLIVHYYKYELTIGIIHGIGVVCIILCFMTSLFWMDLSICEKISYDISHYTCANHVGYRWLGLLSAAMMIFQILITSTIYYYQGFLLTDILQYDPIQEYSADDDLSPFSRNYKGIDD